MCNHDAKLNKDWSGIDHVNSSWMDMGDRFAMWNFLVNRINRKLNWESIERIHFERIANTRFVVKLNIDWDMHLIFDNRGEEVHPAYSLEVGAELLFGAKNIMSLVDIEIELNGIITELKNFEKTMVVSW